MREQGLFVGIDVSKRELDVDSYPQPQSHPRQWVNDEVGRAEAVAYIQGLEPSGIVVEATGGFESALVAELAARQLPIVVVNPRQVRDFAKAIGVLAKTDKVDAQVLARFAQAVRPPLRALPSGQSTELVAVLARRRQIVGMISAESNRLAGASTRIAKDIRRHIVWLRKRLRETDDDLDQQIRRSALWRHKSELLASVPGVGPVTTTTMLAQLPELGVSGPKSHLRPRRRMSLQPRQRNYARAPFHLGRSSPRTRRVVHGDSRGNSPQSGHPRLLPQVAQGRKAQKGGPRGLHAQAARDPQRDH